MIQDISGDLYFTRKSNDIIFILDSKEIIIDFNDAAIDFFCSNMSSSIGNRFSYFIQSLSMPPFPCIEYFNSNNEFPKNDIFYNNNKNLKKYLFTVYKKEKGGKNFYVFWGVETDEYVFKSINFYSIIDSLPGALYWKDLEGRYIDCNKFVLQMAGLNNKDDIIGKTDYDLCWSDQADEWRLADKEVIESGKDIVKEETAILYDGTKLVEMTHKSPLKNKEGKIIGIIGNSLDITEKKKLEKQLMKEKERSDLASHAKTEFIANMSHDLRTPMSGLLGMLDGLLYAADDARTTLSTKANTKLLLSDMLSKVEEYAGMARDSANNLNQLHNDILDNIELESGESKEVDALFNLDQLTQTIVGLQKPVAVNKGLDLTAEIEFGTPCHLKGLYQSLTRILLNLVGNAIKFTESGSVTIVIDLDENKKNTAWHSGDELNLKIQVKDTGMGIPSDKFDEIFGQFSRLTASYEGTHVAPAIDWTPVKRL